MLLAKVLRHSSLTTKTAENELEMNMLAIFIRKSHVRFSAMRVLANVWLVIGVDSSMSCKTRRLETLSALFDATNATEVKAHIREALATPSKGAFMWLVPRMCTTVDSQSTTLNEGLLARLIVTGVGSLVGMYPIMPLKVGFAVEAL